MNQGQKNRAFTLVEMLVVIAIISILAGLSYHAYIEAVRNANRTKDVHNIKQIGQLMFQYASANDFVYPGGNTAGEVFTEMRKEGFLKDYKILISPGSDDVAYKGAGNITNDNTSFSVMVGRTRADGSKGGITGNADGGLPLVFSADSGLSGVAIPTSVVTTEAEQPIAGDGAFGNDGVTVLRVNQSAEFLHARQPDSGEGAVISTKNPFIPAGFEDPKGGTYSVAPGN